MARRTPMAPFALPLLLSLGVAPLAVPAPAAPRAYADHARSTIDLQRAIGARVGRLRAGGVPVLFPRRYASWVPRPLDLQLFHTDGGYEIQVFPLPDCRADDLNCPMFSIRARRDTAPVERVNVRLHGGVPGRYLPRTCDLGCSGPTLEFARRGVVYRFDGPVVGNRKRVLLALANRALAAGPR